MAQTIPLGISDIQDTQLNEITSGTNLS